MSTMLVADVVAQVAQRHLHDAVGVPRARALGVLGGRARRRGSRRGRRARPARRPPCAATRGCAARRRAALAIGWGSSMPSRTNSGAIRSSTVSRVSATRRRRAGVRRSRRRRRWGKLTAPAYGRPARVRRARPQARRRPSGRRGRPGRASASESTTRSAWGKSWDRVIAVGHRRRSSMPAALAAVEPWCGVLERDRARPGRRRASAHAREVEVGRRLALRRRGRAADHAPNRSSSPSRSRWRLDPVDRTSSTPPPSGTPAAVGLVEQRARRPGSTAAARRSSAWCAAQPAGARRSSRRSGRRRTSLPSHVGPVRGCRPGRRSSRQSSSASSTPWAANAACDRHETRTTRCRGSGRRSRRRRASSSIGRRYDAVPAAAHRRHERVDQAVDGVLGRPRRRPSRPCVAGGRRR